jgi:serine O-acetyltransferase
MLGLRRRLDYVFERDPAAHSLLEVLLAYPGVHAVACHRLAHALWCAGFKTLARLVSHGGRLLTGIEIHPGAVLGRRVFIDHGFGVVIGETAMVGDDCTLYQGVTLGGVSWEKGKRHPTLGRGVVIGAGAKVLGPITVGEAARIGSNAVVVKDVPGGATVVGVPGHVVGDKPPKPASLAARLGFEAYGPTRDMPDPQAAALQALLEHTEHLEHRLAMLEQAQRTHAAVSVEAGG